MADEEDEDYMSDTFLLGAAENAPGLVPDKIAKKYKKELKHNELNQRNKIKPMRVRETEHRELGLASALDSSNKGYAMLQKMGFKHGMGLGKDGKLVWRLGNWITALEVAVFWDHYFLLFKYNHRLSFFML